MSAPSPLTAVVQRARALHDSGNLAGALATLTDALEVAAPALGADHPDVLALARLLASLHREAGDLAAARRTLEEALAAGQRVHGEDDPLLLTIAFDLGRVADEFGNRHEARRNYSTVARFGPAVFGPKDPRVGTALAYLGADAPTPVPGAPRTASETPPATEPQPPPNTSTAPLPSTGHTPPPRTSTRPPPRTSPETPPTTGPAPPDRAGLGHETPAGKHAPPLYPTTPRHSSRQRIGVLPRRSRTPIVVALVAAVTVAAVVLIAVVVLRSPRTPPALPPPATATTGSPSPALPAPTGVRLVDDGTSITVVWTDPTNGAVPFIISGARAGEQARAFATLPAGRTTYTVSGLNPRLQYCFTVAAVHSTDVFALSELVCTKRTTGNPQPTASR